MSLTFTHPVLLVGSALAALPILIHLLLRPRPRRVHFPALKLMHSAFAAGQRANRLRNLWLLLARAALLGCAAVLLAGPTCTPVGAGADPVDATACVVVLDDSLSTTYQLSAERTVQDALRQAALDFLRETEAWPASSLFAFVSAGAGDAAPRLTADRAPVAARLRARSANRPHAMRLGGALRDAAELLRSAEVPVRRIVVFTDLAAHAWADVTPATLAGSANLSVRVIGPGLGDRSNLAVAAVSGPARVHPHTAAVPINVSVRADGLAGDRWLVARDGGRVLQRIGPRRPAAEGVHDMVLVLPAMPPGPHMLTLAVEPEDRLDFDQRRYVAFQTGARPVVWLLTPAEAGPGADLSALILRNLIAPESLAADQQIVEFRPVTPDELERAGPASGGTAAPPTRRSPHLLIVLSGTPLSGSAQQAIRDYTRQGATTLLVPRSTEGAGDWPGLRGLLSSSPPVENLVQGMTTIRWESGAPAARDDEELNELSRGAVRRRVTFDQLAEGVAVHARYTDDVPAIVSKSEGQGHVVLLTTSPDPAWSDLGVRAAGLLTWLHHLIESAVGPADAIAEFPVGKRTRQRFGALSGTGLAHVTTPGGFGEGSVWVRLTDGVPDQPWPTDVPGIYRARISGRGREEVGYVVNWPGEESDLSEIGLPRLKTILGLDRVDMDLMGTASNVRGSDWLTGQAVAREVRGLLALGLAGLCLLELVLANRRRRAALT